MTALRVCDRSLLHLDAFRCKPLIPLWTSFTYAQLCSLPKCTAQRVHAPRELRRRRTKRDESVGQPPADGIDMALGTSLKINDLAIRCEALVQRLTRKARREPRDVQSSGHDAAAHGRWRQVAIG